MKCTRMSVAILFSCALNARNVLEWQLIIAYHFSFLLLSLSDLQCVFEFKVSLITYPCCLDKILNACDGENGERIFNKLIFRFCFWRPRKSCELNSTNSFSHWERKSKRKNVLKESHWTKTFPRFWRIAVVLLVVDRILCVDHDKIVCAIRICSCERKAKQNHMKMTHDLLQIVPSEIPRPTKQGKTYYAKGDFLYYHYCCDNYNDVVSWTMHARTAEFSVWIGFVCFLFEGMGLCLSYVANNVLMDRKVSSQNQ